ncbi:hypothetical protein Ddye_026125 [Dipteronia dyeriana]|uniref:Uncharacterized protein n=1 Tax=Dipteronia dyeriana TaxID=168575 RepID=A0AAD9TLL2_9ROSI|nr:hypothetical protein Ddye_026125 [Dipteronia dyeriana]
MVGAGKNKVSFTVEGIRQELKMVRQKTVANDGPPRVSQWKRVARWGPIVETSSSLEDIVCGFNLDIVFLMETKATYSLMELYACIWSDWVSLVNWLVFLMGTSGDSTSRLDGLLKQSVIGWCMIIGISRVAEMANRKEMQKEIDEKRKELSEASKNIY